MGIGRSKPSNKSSTPYVPKQTGNLNTIGNMNLKNIDYINRKNNNDLPLETKVLNYLREKDYTDYGLPASVKSLVEIYQKLMDMNNDDQKEPIWKNKELIAKLTETIENEHEIYFNQYETCKSTLSEGKQLSNAKIKKLYLKLENKDMTTEKLTNTQTFQKQKAIITKIMRSLEWKMNNHVNYLNQLKKINS